MEDGSFSLPELRNTKSTFQRKNYYTVLDQDTPSDVIEVGFYGALDDFLGKLIPDVISIFESGGTPVVSGEILEDIQVAAFDLIKRSPDFVKKYDEVAIGREIISGAVEDALAKKESDETVDLLKQQLANEGDLRAVGRDVRVRAQIRRSERVLEALKEFHVRWAVVDTRHSLVLSSLIAYRIGNGGPNGVSNPNMEIWIPITPKIALVLLRDPNKQVPLRVKIDRDKVREINEYAVRQADQVASHSHELLLSLVK